MARSSQYGDRKTAVIAEIGRRVVEHSKVPTVRELADHFEVSPSTMHSWLGRLEDEGMVEWSPGRHRSLRLTSAGRSSLT